MSYEVWFDDDDGEQGGAIEAYHESLIADGWIDGERADRLIRAIRELTEFVEWVPADFNKWLERRSRVLDLGHGVLRDFSAPEPDASKPPSPKG